MSNRYGGPIEEFHAKWIPEPNSGCHLWTGVVNNYGYGSLLVAGKRMLATHLSLQISGAIKGEFQTQACHTCDVPGCVNPEHLWWGTRSDNIRDSVAKGRNASANRTHCPAGHPLSGDNLLVQRQRTDGIHRKCRECTNKANRDSYRRARAGRLS